MNATEQVVPAKMTLIGFMLLFSLLNPTFLAASGGGTVVDNGGDLIYCGSQSALKIHGLLTTDYVLTRGTSKDVILSTHTEYLEYLRQLISEKIPEWNNSFEDYLASVEINDPRKGRLWRPAQEPLTDIDSDDPVREFPSQCLVESPEGRVPNLIQAVRRRYFVDDTTPKLFYEYDAALLSELKSLNPLQYSYLIFHEFLWDFAPNGYANRWINRLFHSRKIEEMTAIEVKDYIRSHGITSDAGGLIGKVSRQAKRFLTTIDRQASCNSNIRLSQSFAMPSERVRVNPEEEMVFTLVSAPMKEALGASPCAVGFFFSLKKLQVGQGIAQISLNRGRLKETIDMQPGDLVQHVWYGLCTDFSCLGRKGQLAGFFSPQENVETTWKLQVKNRGEVAVELAVPFLMFFGSG